MGPMLNRRTVFLALVAFAAPAQAQQREWTIFFSWNDPALSASGSEIVAQIAATAKQLGSRRIEIGGFTDTSLAKAASVELSKKMTHSVVRELIRLGIPGDTIYSKAFGAENLRVKTAAGVRELQNRRVEIVIK